MDEYRKDWGIPEPQGFSYIIHQGDTQFRIRRLDGVVLDSTLTGRKIAAYDHLVVFRGHPNLRFDVRFSDGTDGDVKRAAGDSWTLNGELVTLLDAEPWTG